MKRREIATAKSFNFIINLKPKRTHADQVSSLWEVKTLKQLNCLPRTHVEVKTAAAASLAECLITNVVEVATAVRCELELAISLLIYNASTETRATAPFV